MTTFPYGYSGSPQGMGSQLTLAQYETLTTVRKLNFEFWRRTKALMVYAASVGVPLGVGTGWRVQPTNGGPGFASPGNSNHEGFPADGTSGGAVAADMVPSTSWGWMQGQVARFGLRTFQYVNNEPWHIQPAEIPASRNWRRTPWVLQAYPLPGDPPAGGYNPWLHLYGDFPTRVKPDLHWLDGYAAHVEYQPYCAYFNHVMVFEAGQKIKLPYEVFTGDEYDNPNTPVGEQGSINALRMANGFFNPNHTNKALDFEAYVAVCGQASWQLVDGLATHFGQPR